MAKVSSLRSTVLQVFGALLLTALAAPQAQADQHGRLRVLPHGYWSCGLPGDALGTAFRADDDLSFTTIPNSSYEAQGGGGTYLLTGDRLTFTRGPLKGRKFLWESANRLRVATDGVERGRLICNRRALGPDARISGRSATDRD
jgi:hypothetical protein